MTKLIEEPNVSRETIQCGTSFRVAEYSEETKVLNIKQLDIVVATFNCESKEHAQKIADKF
ncbi:MAG: hypothetical protein CL720_05095 [Chloroflexi bacterium]|nr:hypothetical protein [Chloroflexota bacterium]|tara:strand:+ start:2960 stop:3142 length:183 start_codon:yes stop_codon:yes gene_type:complete